MGRSIAARIALIASLLALLPAKAPFRSTQCSQRKPWAAKLLACAPGSVLKTVASAITPFFRRTQTPSFRSMAGKMIIFVRHSPLMLRQAQHEDFCLCPHPEPVEG